MQIKPDQPFSAGIKINYFSKRHGSEIVAYVSLEVHNDKYHVQEAKAINFDDVK